VTDGKSGRREFRILGGDGGRCERGRLLRCHRRCAAFRQWRRQQGARGCLLWEIPAMGSTGMPARSARMIPRRSHLLGRSDSPFSFPAQGRGADSCRPEQGRLRRRSSRSGFPSTAPGWSPEPGSTPGFPPSGAVARFHSPHWQAALAPELSTIGASAICPTLLSFPRSAWMGHPGNAASEADLRTAPTGVGGTGIPTS
jgi:hypothetical protein